MFLTGICFITETSSSPLSSAEMTLMALRAGVRWVQYREKQKNRHLLYYEALNLRRLTRDFRAKLIVNDYVDIALAVNADGVHLGQEDLPIAEARRILGKDKIIGVSTHSIKEALRAEKQGADYIGFGPIFHTTTKDAGPPKGLAMLRRIKSAVNIPVVAIGGINIENLPSVLETGVDAVAVASAILKGDIKKNARGFLKIIQKHGVRV
ncbi:MAG: thiamine phosphate synthase [Nitrospirae bacterium]|nr:thiamine phosphate synthase [Nitrospirota bacterium]